MTAMRLHRYPSPSGGIALGKMGVGATMMRSILPAGARWVEYLEGTGTQWIDTNYKPNSMTELSIVYKPANYGTTFRCVWGVQGGTNGQRFYSVLSGLDPFKIQIGSIANSSYYCGFNTNGTITNNTNGNFAPDSRLVSMVVDNPQKRVILNDVGYTMPNWWGVDLSCPDSLALFGRKSERAIQTANLFIGKIERCNISEAGTPVRSFAPIAIGTTGYMLDLVSGEYLPYGNKGTGDFVIGPDINAPAI